VADERATMFDLARETQNGKIIPVVHALAKSNPIFQDAPYFEANDTTSHVIARDNAINGGSWRLINAGVDATAGNSKQIREFIGNYEGRLEVDEYLLKIAADKAQFLRNREYSHLEKSAQDIVDAMLYGNIGTDPQSFNGILTRLALQSDTDEAGETLTHSYGGSTTLSSLIIVQWGEGNVYMTYPKGSRTVGIEREDRGIERVDGSNSKAMYAYVIRYMYNGGLVIEDDRCIRRVANVEPTGTSNNFLDSSYGVDTLIDAIVSMKDAGEGAVIYMNKSLWGQLWKVAKDKTNVWFDKSNPWGARQYDFDGIPVRLLDNLIKTESAVS